MNRMTYKACGETFSTRAAAMTFIGALLGSGRENNVMLLRYDDECGWHVPSREFWSENGAVMWEDQS